MGEKFLFIFISSTNIQEVVEEIAKKEPLITSSRKEQVLQLVQSNLNFHRINFSFIFQLNSLIKGLQQKIAQPDDRYFYLFKVNTKNL